MRFVAMLIANSLILICYILILTLVAPLLCLVAFVYVATTTLIFKKLSARLVQIAGQGLTQAHQTFNQLFYETVHGTRLIRISGAVEAMQDQIVQVVGQLGRARFVNVAVENMTFPFFSTVGGVLISILVMLVGTMKPEAAAPAVGLLVIFFVLLFRILSPLTLINIARTNIVIHIEALDQLDQLEQGPCRAR